jgi:hypothetical protein
MPIENIKNIFLIITLIILLFDLVLGGLKRKPEQLFAAISFLVTIVIFMFVSIKLHHILRRDFSIPNTVTYILGGVPVLYLFYKCKFQIIQTNFLILVSAINFIFLAVAIDLMTDANIVSFNGSDFVEEILRILGTGFWMVYYIIFSLRLGKK